MTRDQKERLAQVFDLLGSIMTGKHTERHSSHGSGLACAVCGSSNAVTHNPDCAAHKALNLISPLMPPWSEREKWLAAEA